MSKFSREPKIIFTRVICPFCKNPTGPDSTCYSDENNKDIHITKDGIALSIFNEGCVFRQDYLWYVDFNYPLSEPLVLKLSKVEGLNKFGVINPYRAQIAIAPAFNELEVKKNVILSFKSFVKEMSVTESIKIGIKEFKPTTVCIRMPNGQTYEQLCNNEDEYFLIINTYKDLQEKLEKVEIFEKE